MDALGASWAVFLRHFGVLVFGVLSGRALGASWARFWLDLEGSGEGLGRVLDVQNRVQKLKNYKNAQQRSHSFFSDNLHL